MSYSGKPLLPHLKHCFWPSGCLVNFDKILAFTSCGPSLLSPPMVFRSYTHQLLFFIFSSFSHMIIHSLIQFLKLRKYVLVHTRHVLIKKNLTFPLALHPEVMTLPFISMALSALVVLTCFPNCCSFNMGHVGAELGHQTHRN